MKQIKIVFETDDKKIGYILDVEARIYQSCEFGPDYSIGQISQTQPITNIKFLTQQIINVIMGAFK